jgi:2-polyprenyl-3-methyl-5-hydroxy-6-metoxy-1,4-benzoquinol methylase
MNSGASLYWKTYPVSEIPSKEDIAPLYKWCKSFPSPKKTKILDVGCGNGDVCHAISQRGFNVCGIDINNTAITSAQLKFPEIEFKNIDVTSYSELKTIENSFDGIICQLLFSVVGDLNVRKKILLNLFKVLNPGGRIFASFSGLSDDINEEYKRLYTDDLKLTSEFGTYFSRDRDGNVLYVTHHFSKEETVELFCSTGFSIQCFEERIETSSRRKNQKARFFYVEAIIANDN